MTTRTGDGACGDDLVIARAARELREPVPVRDAWRSALLAELQRPPHDTPREMAPSRRLVLRPLAAVAAGITLLLAGAAGGSWLARSVSIPAGPRDYGIAAVAPAAEAQAAAARFVVRAPGAQRVALVGDFNLWDDGATPMRPAGDGRTWVVELPLQPGRHAYAFIIDGTVVLDPAAPRADDDDFGRPNSVMVVSNPAS